MNSKEFYVEISIALQLENENAEEIVNMYENNFKGDMDQTAWNLCNCDDTVQAEKFSNLKITTYQVVSSTNNDVQLSIAFEVTGKDVEFIHRVVEEYMDGFMDWISVTRNNYYSRTGSKEGTVLLLKSWLLKEIK